MFSDSVASVLGARDKGFPFCSFPEAVLRGRAVIHTFHPVSGKEWCAPAGFPIRRCVVRIKLEFVLNKIKWLAGFLGFGFVLYLFESVGWNDIVQHLSTLGWMAPVIFLPFVFSNIINTWAWIVSFPPPFSQYKLSFFNLFLIRICGEAVNNFTPTAHVGGDIVRVLCLKKLAVPSTASLVGVIMDKATLIISQILFIFVGIFLFLGQANWPPSTRVQFAAMFFLALLVIYGIVLAVHRGVFSKVSKMMSEKFRWQSLQRLDEKVKHLDIQLTRFYNSHPRQFRRSNYLHFAGWVFGALETWLMLYLLGHSLGILDAIMIEALIVLFKGLGFLVPGSLGFLEGGAILIFQGLDFGSGLGLAFSLLKRAREIFFAVIGWLALTLQFAHLKLDAPKPIAP